MWVLLLILKILLYLLAAFLLLLLTLLVVPFTYKGEAEISGGISFSYKIGWFWNLFSIRGNRSEESKSTEVFLGSKRLFTVNTEEKDEEESGETEEETKEDKYAAKKENNLKSMFDTALIKEILNYLKKIINQIKPKYLHLYGSYGFDDPALTGMTAGFIYTLQGIWPQSRINLTPCFTEAVLELELKAAGSIYAGRLAWDTGRLLLKKEVRTKIFNKGKK